MGNATTPPPPALPGSDVPSTPVRNLRVRFWGVQGSCPMFPEPREVDEYRWLVARDALKRMILDLRARAGGGAVSVEALLDKLDADDALAAYHKKLGESVVPVYGGETTCAVVETSEGNVIVIDGGSAIRNASKHMIRTWPAAKPREINILATHEHLDHRSGLPFCQFCFARPPFDIRIHSTRQFLKALDVRYGIYSKRITPQTYYDDPIDYRMMSAKFTGFEIPGPDDRADPQDWGAHPPDQPIRIGSTVITPFDVYHGPTRCLAYKIVHGAATFVFCTDHELRHAAPGAAADESDPRRQKSLAAERILRRHCEGADLAYFDGQYHLDEYFGKTGIGVTAAVPRIDWGHGTIEDAVDRARDCHIKHTLIGHHDPERSWPERLGLDVQLAAQSQHMAGRIELAQSDMTVEL
jgi:hypothetical protein